MGAAALGYLVGLLLAGWSSHVVESGEMLILLAGSILSCVGVSRPLNLSPLVGSLAVGAATVNLADRSRHLFGTLSTTDRRFRLSHLRHRSRRWLQTSSRQPPIDVLPVKHAIQLGTD